MARSDKEKNPWPGLIIGPALIVLSTMALWKNEHRFDYHKAAQKTVPAVSMENIPAEELFSYTGGMDRDLTLNGKYVDPIVGFLTVKRQAQIYCWNEEEDDDGTTWTLQWMSSVESNSRNSGVKQTLSSHTFIPETYAVDDLTILSPKIEFVDPYETIPPETLPLTPDGKNRQLKVDGEYYHLAKGKPRDLGDERIKYRAIPVPAIATYFGKSRGDREAVFHQAVKREHFLDAIIKDSGILHHLVAGERGEALGTMKAHIRRLKLIVRAAGTALIFVGFGIFFAVFTRFLMHIPVIGSIVSGGVFILSLVLTVIIAGTTILTGMLSANPIALGVILGTTLFAILFIRGRSKASQKQFKQNLDQQIGHEVSYSEIKELEFLELVRIAQSDATVDAQEKAYLHQWGKKHRWPESKVNELIEAGQRIPPPLTNNAATSQDHLMHLIRLSFADGSLAAHELKTIRKAASDLGYDRKALHKMMDQVRRSGGNQLA